MRYRVKSGDWIEFSGPDSVTPLNKRGDVLLVIDPGKTNMAVVIGNPYGVIYTFVEISGTGCDTTEYCSDLKVFFNAFLKNVKVYKSAVEAAVTYQGFKYHKSQMVLTEIRAAILSYFSEVHHAKPSEINNYAWKGAILPDGYRGHKEKGSLRYLNEQGIHGITHDVSDAVCMFMYLTKLTAYNKELICDATEAPTVPYIYTLIGGKLTEEDKKHPWSKYNCVFSFPDNVAYLLNRSISQTVIMEVPIEQLTQEDIYGACSVLFPNKDEQCVKVVVARNS